MSNRTRHGIGQRKSRLVVEPLEDRQLPSVNGLDFLATVSQPEYSPSLQQETEFSFVARKDGAEGSTLSRLALIHLQTTLEAYPLLNRALGLRDASPLLANLDPARVLVKSDLLGNVVEHSFLESRVELSSVQGLLDRVKESLSTKPPVRSLFHSWLENRDVTSQPAVEVRNVDETKPSTFVVRDEVLLNPLPAREKLLPPPRPRHVLPWRAFKLPDGENNPGLGRSHEEEVKNQDDTDDPQNLPAKASHPQIVGSGKSDNQEDQCGGHMGAMLPWGFTIPGERSLFLDDDLAGEEENDGTLQGAGLLPGATVLSTEALDAVLGQLAAGLDEMGRSLTETLTGYGSSPWLLGVLVTGLAVEISMRRTHKQRLRVGVAGLGADPTFSWMPGLPGSFSAEQE